MPPGGGGRKRSRRRSAEPSVPGCRAYLLEGRGGGVGPGRGTPGGEGVSQVPAAALLLVPTRGKFPPDFSGRPTPSGPSSRAFGAGAVPARLRGDPRRDAWGALPGPRRRGRAAAAGAPGAAAPGLGLLARAHPLGGLLHLPGAVPGLRRVRPAAAARPMPPTVRVLRGGAHRQVRQPQPDRGARRAAPLRAQPLPHRRPAGRAPRRRLRPPAAAGRAGGAQPQRQPPGGGARRRLRASAQPAPARPQPQPAGPPQPLRLLGQQRQRLGPQPPAGTDAQPHRAPCQRAAEPELRGHSGDRPASGPRAARPPPPGAGQQPPPLPAPGPPGPPAWPQAPGPARQLPGEPDPRVLPQPDTLRKPPPGGQRPQGPPQRHAGRVARPAPRQGLPGQQSLGVRLPHGGHGGLAQGDRGSAGQSQAHLCLPGKNEESGPLGTQQLRPGL